MTAAPVFGALPVRDLAGPAERVFRAHDLSKVYRLGDIEVHALRSLSLELFRGEFLVILGLPGAENRPC